MWETARRVQAFQQQLAEIAIAGFQPQFTTWVSLLTDPAVSGMARDVVLSGCHDGPSALYQRHPHPGDPLVI